MSGFLQSKRGARLAVITPSQQLLHKKVYKHRIITSQSVKPS